MGLQQRRRAGADDGVNDLAHHELMVTHGDKRVSRADQVGSSPGKHRQAARPGAPSRGRAEPVRSLVGKPGGDLFLAVAHQVDREVPGGADRGPVG